MKTVLEEISHILADAFVACGYDADLGKVSVSNRPDLCEFQCNGAMAGAKRYKKAPIMIANAVVEILKENQVFTLAEALMPGFINLKVNKEYLVDYAIRMAQDEKYGCSIEEKPKKVVIDFGGPNVAKPLHIGHLRSAIIGETIKRINVFLGNEVIGDVHLGDWGLQMGLIIEELKDRKPELVYYDESFTGEYPTEPPFTLSELEEIYPTASKRAKAKVKDENGEDTDVLTPEAKAFSERAHKATYLLQNGYRGYEALWKHILSVSIPDLKRNYVNLNVSFDIWKGESDAKPFIPGMIQKMKDLGLAYESQGALIMDVKEESDTKEVPPALLMKSDGAALYHTTDLATIVDREASYHPDEILYVVDKRQEMHFTQVFRAARKSGLVPADTKLTFLGFGTMNGKDGKPFKTRAGGVMRLEHLIADTNQEVYNKMLDREMEEAERLKISQMVGLAAIKYGDLSNQPTKDYIFDLDRFTAFEGNTGPYILYTIVRIKSILQKVSDTPKKASDMISAFYSADSASERDLYLMLTRFNEYIRSAYEEIAPQKICSYLFELANRFNKFYHDTKILSETDSKVKDGYIALITLTKEVLETAIDLLGFEAPDRM